MENDKKDIDEILDNKLYLGSFDLSNINALKEKGIPYLFVAPDPACKNEYLIRYLRRGSSVSFIKKLSDMWCEYIWPLEDETIIRLGKGVYLDDILSEGIWC